MSRRLVVRPAALEELAEARNWYASRRDDLGDEFLQAVEDRFGLLAESPESYAIEYRDVRAAPLRGFPYVV